MPDLLRLVRPKKSLEQRVLSAQSGDEAERNELIDEYKPFVKKVLSQQLGRYIEEENDTCYAVGLAAFNEAINQYQKNRGAFLAFSTSVIRSRSIDQLRREKRYDDDVPLSALDPDQHQGHLNANRQLSVPGPEEQLLIREDLQVFIQRMSRLGITLDDLIRESPKHEDTRRNAIRAARCLFNSSEYSKDVLKTGKMPFKELEQQVGLSKKAVMRSRKFILAVLLILKSDLDTMKQYIRSIEQEEQK
jgi:RNA polymerase sigma factor